MALIGWQGIGWRASAVNLTAEDMALIAADQAPQTRARLASDEAARKDFNWLTVKRSITGQVSGAR